MLDFLLGIVIAGIPLVGVEILTRVGKFAGELPRKTTHLLSSVTVVIITTFCSLHQIAAIAILFTCLLLITRRRGLWHSLYKVQRHSWGEITFPIGVAIVAIMAHSTRSFIACVLVLGIADTAASIVGQKFKSPKLPGSTHKTYAGSVACLLCAALIIAACAGGFGWLALGLVIIASLAESIASIGLDNIALPLAMMLYINLTAMRFG